MKTRIVETQDGFYAHVRTFWGWRRVDGDWAFARVSGVKVKNQ